MPIPLPTATPTEVERVQTLYWDRYCVTLTFEQARDLLEGLMRFYYLTRVEPHLAPLRQQEAQDAPQVSAPPDPPNPTP
jgi:hypothetical protein